MRRLEELVRRIGRVKGKPRPEPKPANIQYFTTDRRRRRKPRGSG